MNDYRCVHCKLVVAAVQEPERCAECGCRTFAKCDQVSSPAWIRALAECCHVAGELHAVRGAGFTERALHHPRSALALRLLAAFNGMPAHMTPPRGWRYFPDEASRYGWERVKGAACGGGDALVLLRAWAPSVEFPDFPNEATRKAWQRVHAAAQDWLAEVLQPAA